MRARNADGGREFGKPNSGDLIKIGSGGGIFLSDSANSGLMSSEERARLGVAALCDCGERSSAPDSDFTDKGTSSIRAEEKNARAILADNNFEEK